VPSPTSPDIDRILGAIRAEARTRGAKGQVGAYSTEISGGAFHVASYGLPRLDTRHVADFLALPLDEFIGEAYRQLLGREPDASGAANFQRAMLRGRLTRIEVLGWVWLSSEGRRRGNGVPGLGLAFAIATFYRLPLAGPVAALAARALRFPAHWQDRSRLESAALATGAWMKR
jgi:hypothetical protein